MYQNDLYEDGGNVRNNNVIPERLNFSPEKKKKKQNKIGEKKTITIDSGMALGNASVCSFSASFNRNILLPKYYDVSLTQLYIGNINCCATSGLNVKSANHF